MLLRKYPDAAMGRNKFDWIPLEEALFAAGENGRLFTVGWEELEVDQKRKLDGQW